MNKVIVYILFVGLFLIGCSDAKEATIAEENRQEMAKSATTSTVEVVKIENTVFEKQLLSNGSIEALQKSELRFKISEQVATIHVKNGVFVKKGTLLATLDNIVLKNELEKATINLENAKRNLRQEKINYGFSEIEESKIDPVKLKYMYLRSGYREAKNTLENAQIRYNQTLLQAPFSGVVANLDTKAGDYVTSGDIFCIIINKKQMEVSFSVLENEIPFVKIDQKITVHPFMDTDVEFEGIITEINPLVDNNGLVNIKGRIQNPNAALFDGMHVKVVLNKPLENVIVIPREAVVIRENKEVVFTSYNGKAQWNYVEILDENSKSYALKSGLQLNDTIIVDGNMNLSHNSKISPIFKSTNTQKRP